MFHNMQKLFVNTSEAQNFITQEVRTCCFPFHIGSAKSEIKMYKILILQPPTANIATVFWFLLFFVFFSFFLLFCDHQPHNWGRGGEYCGRWDNPQNELCMDPIVVFVATIVSSLASDYTISK